MGWKRPLGFWHLPCEEILQVYCMMAEGAAFELQLVVAHALGTSGSVSDASSVYCCLISLLMTQKSEKTDLSCKARSSRGLQGGEFQKVAEWLFHPPWRIKFGIGLLVQQDCVLVTQSVLLSLSLLCVCTCAHMHVYGGQKTTLVSFLGSLNGLELTKWAMLASYQAPEPLPLWPRIISMPCHLALF